jgi:hypothetical protein
MNFTFYGPFNISGGRKIGIQKILFRKLETLPISSNQALIPIPTVAEQIIFTETVLDYQMGI